MRLRLRKPDTHHQEQGYMLELKVGKGAGYIRGLTAFFALNCRVMRFNKRRIPLVGRRTYVRFHNRKRLQLGVTRNANIVPLQ